SCTALRVARKQRFVLFGKVEEDRAAFEQAHFAVAQDGNLAPRLVAIMFGWAVDGADQMLGIVDPHFLARPARTQVANEAAREVGNPVKSGDLDGGVRVYGHGSSPWTVGLAGSRCSEKTAGSGGVVSSRNGVTIAAIV